MTHTWFIYANDVVSGPFETDLVLRKLESGAVSDQSFIWWKGQREWVQITTWRAQLTQLLQTSQERATQAVWYLDAGANPVGPLTEGELIQQLRALTSLSRVRLWAAGMEKWTSLYELADIMELLGISRRENERAPLMGTVAVTRSNDDPKGFSLRATSISVGGIGLAGQHDLRVGDAVSVLVKSSEIPQAMHLRGEIAYVTASGHAGVRFEKVHPETQSLIFDYVKRFNADEMAGAKVA